MLMCWSVSLFSYPLEHRTWDHDSLGHISHCLRKLTLTVLVTTTDAQWEGMGDVGSARYELALLPPCPTIRVLSYNN